MSFAVQIEWAKEQHTLQGGFPTRKKAEWAINGWRQRYRVLGDPFSIVEESPTPTSGEQKTCVQCGCTLPREAFMIRGKDGEFEHDKCPDCLKSNSDKRSPEPLTEEFNQGETL